MISRGIRGKNSFSVLGLFSLSVFIFTACDSDSQPTADNASEAETQTDRVQRIIPEPDRPTVISAAEGRRLPSLDQYAVSTAAYEVTDVTCANGKEIEIEEHAESMDELTSDENNWLLSTNAQGQLIALDGTDPEELRQLSGVSCRWGYAYNTTALSDTEFALDFDSISCTDACSAEECARVCEDHTAPYMQALSRAHNLIARSVANKVSEITLISHSDYREEAERNKAYRERVQRTLENVSETLSDLHAELEPTCEESQFEDQKKIPSSLEPINPKQIFITEYYRQRHIDRNAGRAQEAIENEGEKVWDEVLDQMRFQLNLRHTRQRFPIIRQDNPERDFGAALASLKRGEGGSVDSIDLRDVYLCSDDPNQYDGLDESEFPRELAIRLQLKSL